MTIHYINYDSPAYRVRPMTKRERAAEAIEEGNRLLREIAEEEAREAALDAEYGPRLVRKTD